MRINSFKIFETVESTFFFIRVCVCMCVTVFLSLGKRLKWAVALISPYLLTLFRFIFASF